MISGNGSYSGRLKVMAKFVAAFVVMTIGFQIVWEFTVANLYDDTDDNGTGAV